MQNHGEKRVTVSPNLMGLKDWLDSKNSMLSMFAAYRNVHKSSWLQKCISYPDEISSRLSMHQIPSSVIHSCCIAPTITDTIIIVVVLVVALKVRLSEHPTAVWHGTRQDDGFFGTPGKPQRDGLQEYRFLRLVRCC